MADKGKKNEKKAGWLGLFGLSTVAGILSMALVLPVVWLGGLGASATVSIFQSLPDFIKPVNAADASNIYAMQKSFRFHQAS